MGLGADEDFCERANDIGTVSYYSVNTTDTKILDYWRALYRGISRANLLIANIDDPAIVIDPAKRNSIKGEALFLRGYYYMLLVTRFGGVPLVLAPTVSASADAVQIPRATLKETYEQVLADMQQAADLVRDVTAVESGGRISKSTVWGMLTRVCLYMAGNPLNETARYADAAMWADKVISLGYHQLNPSFQQVFINYAQDKYDTKESIWEIEFWGNGTGIYDNTTGYWGIHNGIKYPTGGTAGYGYSNGLSHPTQYLYDVYESGDLRRDWTIAPFRYVSDVVTNWPATASAMQKFCGKFRRTNELVLPKSTSATPQNCPLLRYSDVLLMYAEAINESNGEPTPAALDAVNQVRRRAWGATVNVANPAVDLPSTLNQATFKDEIKRERSRELAFELLRKNDVVRWGDFFNNMKTRLLEVPAGTAAYAESARICYTGASQRDVIWPIPAYEMGVNHKLVQNNGW